LAKPSSQADGSWVRVESNTESGIAPNVSSRKDSTVCNHHLSCKNSINFQTQITEETKRERQRKMRSMKNIESKNTQKKCTMCSDYVMLFEKH